MNQTYINKMTDMAEEKIEHLASGIQTITHETAEQVCDYIKSRLETLLSNYKNLAN